MANSNIPKPEDVMEYLSQYKLESVIEEAVNDAVLKQVKVRASGRLDFDTRPRGACAGAQFSSLCPPRVCDRAEPVPAHRRPAPEACGG